MVLSHGWDFYPLISKFESFDGFIIKKCLSLHKNQCYYRNKSYWSAKHNNKLITFVIFVIIYFYIDLSFTIHYRY